jgi:hypothetical protein
MLATGFQVASARSRQPSAWSQLASRPGLDVGVASPVQGFGRGGVIATFRLALDLIGFVLLLVFVLLSSVILLAREDPMPDTAAPIGTP